jgi:hypothetical protein
METMRELFDKYGRFGRTDHKYIRRALELLGKPVNISGVVYQVQHPTAPVIAIDTKGALPETTLIPTEILNSIRGEIPRVSTHYPRRED